jgi:hypothetical protein
VRIERDRAHASEIDIPDLDERVARLEADRDEWAPGADVEGGRITAVLCRTHSHEGDADHWPQRRAQTQAEAQQPEREQDPEQDLVEGGPTRQAVLLRLAAADTRALPKTNPLASPYSSGPLAQRVDAGPSLALAWNGLAMVLERKGDLDGAIEAARKLVALEPDEALGHTSLSMLYQRKGLIQESEDEKAIATRLAMTKR